MAGLTNVPIPAASTTKSIDEALSMMVRMSWVL
jgi:hypothetical protein